MDFPATNIPVITKVVFIKEDQKNRRKNPELSLQIKDGAKPEQSRTIFALFNHP